MGIGVHGEEELAELRRTLNERDDAVAVLRGELSSVEEERGRLRAAEGEVAALKEGDLAQQARINEVQARLASEAQRNTALSADVQALQTEKLAATADVRRLEFEVDRLQHNLDAQARRLGAGFTARFREETQLWLQHVHIEVEQAEERAAIEKLASSRRLLELVREEGVATGAKVAEVSARFEAQLQASQEEIRTLEMKLCASEDAQAKHVQLAALARQQLDGHRDLKEKETLTLQTERQRRKQDCERIEGEKAELEARAIAAETELVVQRKAVEEVRSKMELARRERHDALATLSDEREDRMRALKGLKDQVVQSNLDREGLMKKVPNFELEKGRLEERITSLEEARRRQDDEIRVLRREREEAEAKVGEVRQQFRDKQKGDELEILRLLRNDRNWRLERSEMEDEMKRLSHECTLKTRDALDVQREFSHLAKKANKATRKHREMKKETLAMSSRLNNLSLQGEHARRAMLSEVQDVKGQHLAAATDLEEEKHKFSHAWEGRLKEQDRELARANTELHAKGRKIDTLKARLAELQTVEKYSMGLNQSTNVPPRKKGADFVPLTADSELDRYMAGPLQGDISADFDDGPAVTPVPKVADTSVVSEVRGGGHDPRSQNDSVYATGSTAHQTRSYNSTVQNRTVSPPRDPSIFSR